MKTCRNSKCPNVNPQPLDNFFNDKGFKSGKMAICKTCKQAKTYAWRKKNPEVYNGRVAEWRKKNPDKQHATEIKRNYGVSIEAYNQLLTEQNCQCKICGKHHDPTAKRGRLYVDHCHQTGTIRGLLCSACNSALGYLKDDISLLDAAKEYLAKYK